MGAKNKPIPTGKWYFSFQFSNTTEQGRQQHEDLQDLIDDSEHKQLATGFGPVIRNDFGPMDALERILRDFQIS